MMNYRPYLITLLLLALAAGPIPNELRVAASVAAPLAILGFLALVLFVDKAEDGGQRVPAFAEALQVALEIDAVTTFFQNAVAAGRQQILVPFLDIGAVAQRNDISVPAAFPVHIGPRLIGNTVSIAVK